MAFGVAMETSKLKHALSTCNTCCAIKIDYSHVMGNDAALGANATEMTSSRPQHRKAAQNARASGNPRASGKAPHRVLEQSAEPRLPPDETKKKEEKK